MKVSKKQRVEGGVVQVQVTFRPFGQTSGWHYDVAGEIDSD
jgi:hypothetical protein